MVNKLIFLQDVENVLMTILRKEATQAGVDREDYIVSCYQPSASHIYLNIRWIKPPPASVFGGAVTIS